MPRATGRWEGDNGFGDAYSWFGVDEWLFFYTTAPTLTRGAAGNYYQAFAATQTVTCVLPLDSLMQRTGYAYADQEQFGGTYGPGPAYGNPPFTGANQLVPISGFAKKGIEIQDITVVYGISTANLTSQTPLMKQAVFANNVAVAVTTITLSTATSLATASTTNPYVTKLAISTPAYTVSDLTALSFENTVAIAASSAYNLYGAFVHMTFNLA